MSEWISVEDRLPTLENDGESLLIFHFGHTGYAFWDQWKEPGRGEIQAHDGQEFMIRNSDSDYGGLFIAGDVTHWMPLPEPPK